MGSPSVVGYCSRTCLAVHGRKPSLWRLETPSRAGAVVRRVRRSGIRTLGTTSGKNPARGFFCFTLAGVRCSMLSGCRRRDKATPCTVVAPSAVAQIGTTRLWSNHGRMVTPEPTGRVMFTSVVHSGSAAELCGTSHCRSVQVALRLFADDPVSVAGHDPPWETPTVAFVALYAGFAGCLCRIAGVVLDGRCCCGRTRFWCARGAVYAGSAGLAVWSRAIFPVCGRPVGTVGGSDLPVASGGLANHFLFRYLARRAKTSFLCKAGFGNTKPTRDQERPITTVLKVNRHKLRLAESYRAKGSHV